MQRFKDSVLQYGIGFFLILFSLFIIDSKISFVDNGLNPTLIDGKNATKIQCFIRASEKPFFLDSAGGSDPFQGDLHIRIAYDPEYTLEVKTSPDNNTLHLINNDEGLKGTLLAALQSDCRNFLKESLHPKGSYLTHNSQSIEFAANTKKLCSKENSCTFTALESGEIKTLGMTKRTHIPPIRYSKGMAFSTFKDIA